MCTLYVDTIKTSHCQKKKSIEKEKKTKRWIVKHSTISDRFIKLKMSAIKKTNYLSSFNDLTVSVLRILIHLKNEKFKRMIYKFPSLILS